VQKEGSGEGPRQTGKRVCGNEPNRETAGAAPKAELRDATSIVCEIVSGGGKCPQMRVKSGDTDRPPLRGQLTIGSTTSIPEGVREGGQAQPRLAPGRYQPQIRTKTLLISLSQEGSKLASHTLSACHRWS